MENHNMFNFDKELNDYKQWLGEQDEKFDSSLAGVSTNVTNNMFGDIQNENYKMGQDLKSNVGSEKTRFGEAAEKIEVRNRNAKHILKGEEASAKKETNRIHQTTDFYDDGTAYQSKFYDSPQATLNSLLDSKHDYRGVDKVVPKEQYEEIMKLAKERQKYYEKKAKQCKESGDEDGYNKYKDKADKCKDILKTAHPGTYSKFAKFAQAHPNLYTAGQMTIDAVSAGAAGGVVAAAVTGVTQTINNVFDLLDGKTELSDAVKNTAKSMGGAAKTGFMYGATGSVINGGLKIASEKVVNETAKNVLNTVISTNAVTYGLVATVEFSKTIKKFFDNEISKKEMFIQLGETSVGMAGSIIGGIVGSVAGPIGEIIGSTVGYMITTSFYRSVFELKRLKSMAAEYSRLIPIFQEAQRGMEEARKKFVDVCRKYRIARMDSVEESLEKMKTAAGLSGIDDFLAGLNQVLAIYGEGIKYSDFEAFDNDMRNDSIQIIF